MSLLNELKRRNVVRVAVAYTVIAWVLAQVADLAFDNFGTPEWVGKTVLFMLVLGFPLAVFFSWAFEMTPEGVKKEKDVDRSQSITNQTGRKLDFLITAVLVIAVGWLLVDRFVISDDAAEMTTQASGEVVTDKSVAVLPFVAMSNGPDDEYFADGLTEEILNSLAQLPELLVTARTSAFSFKGLDIPIPEIATTLGVAHIVEGSVRRAGERVRITAQLIRANDGFHLWSDTYERSDADSFGIQVEIAEKVAAALDIILDQSQLQRMHARGLNNPEAFIAYQRGIEIYNDAHNFNGADSYGRLLQANEYFERVIELEPEYSPAHYNHADYYVHFVTTGASEGTITAEDAAEALRLADVDHQNAVRTASTRVDDMNARLEQALLSGQWRRLRSLFNGAMQSTECMAPAWWGGTLTGLDPSLAAVEMWQRESECDPLNFYGWTNRASSLISLGEFQAAIDVAAHGLEIVPHRQIATQLVRGLIGAGDLDGALAASERHINEDFRRQRNRAMIAAARGDKVEFQAILNEAVSDAPPVSGFLFAIGGDRESANRWAAEQDKLPLGFLNLANTIIACNCGLAFDLDVTPNFAKFVDEADIPWPPASPIDWPLKDW